MTPTLRTGLLAASMGLGMFGLGFASEPLYRMFCQVTGFGGTTQKNLNGVAPGAVAGKSMVIRFDANRDAALPWAFGPEVNRQEVQVGARQMAFYTAENQAKTDVTGMATFNVSPAQAGPYFVKTQCFCFNEQKLAGGQKIRMPVLFYVDPKILTDPDTKDIEEITLSYTFSPVDEVKKRG